MKRRVIFLLVQDVHALSWNPFGSCMRWWGLYLVAGFKWLAWPLQPAFPGKSSGCVLRWFNSMNRFAFLDKCVVMAWASLGCRKFVLLMISTSWCSRSKGVTFFTIEWMTMRWLDYQGTRLRPQDSPRHHQHACPGRRTIHEWIGAQAGSRASPIREKQVVVMKRPGNANPPRGTGLSNASVSVAPRTTAEGSKIKHNLSWTKRKKMTLLS